MRCSPVPLCGVLFTYFLDIFKMNQKKEWSMQETLLSEQLALY